MISCNAVVSAPVFFPSCKIQLNSQSGVSFFANNCINYSAIVKFLKTIGTFLFLCKSNDWCSLIIVMDIVTKWPLVLMQILQWSSLTHDCFFFFITTDTYFERFYGPRFCGFFKMMLLWTCFEIQIIWEPRAKIQEIIIEVKFWV